MTNKITKFMTCFIIYWDKKEVGFISFIPVMEKSDRRYRITRIVILPDFQGLGISKAILETFGAMYKANGITVTIRTVHIGLGEYLENSSKWVALSSNLKKTSKTGKLKNNNNNGKIINYIGRSAYSYKYVGDIDNDNDIVKIKKDVYKNTSFNQISIF